MGLTLDQAIELIDAMGAGEPSAGAIRARRYRERGGGKIPEELRQRIFERDGWACLECGSADYLQCDHVHPVSRGGATEEGNLQTLCRVCNARKKDRVRKSEVRGMSVEIPPEGSAENPGTPSLSRPLSPQTPLTPTQTHPDITTRATASAKASGFAEFWGSYPNKVGKRDAEKSYVAALKRITGPDPPSVIFDGVTRAKTSRKWLDGIIPNPATWLNQDRWEDQPSEIIPLQPRQPHERPHRDPKFDARQANLARALAGAESAAGRRWEP